MSHSQFHSTKLFILRHAWLNLWDKHMTTGRINQVTLLPEEKGWKITQMQKSIWWLNTLSLAGLHRLCAANCNSIKRIRQCYLFDRFTTVKCGSCSDKWSSHLLETEIPVCGSCFWTLHPIASLWFFSLEPVLKNIIFFKTTSRQWKFH